MTAQKRTENLQDVPISIQALSTTKLEELHISNFDDYVKYLPSVSFQSAGPGFEHTYIRGVVSGGDGNHSGSLPSVGMYLDEQPVTTIDGNLDIHIYDIQRVEVLNWSPAGYPVRGEFGGGHDPHHHQQAGSERLQGRLRYRRQYRRPRRQRLHGRGLRELAPRAHCCRALGRLGRAQGRVHRQCARLRRFSRRATSAFNNAPLCQEGFQRRRYPGRARRAESRSERPAGRITPTLSWVAGHPGHPGNFAYKPAVGDLQIQWLLPETVHDSWVRRSSLDRRGQRSAISTLFMRAPI